MLCLFLVFWGGGGGEQIEDAVGDPKLLKTVDDKACGTAVVSEPAAASSALDGWRYPLTSVESDAETSAGAHPLHRTLDVDRMTEGGMMQRFHQCAVQHCRWCAFPVRRCFYADHLSVCAPRPCLLCDAPVRTVDLAAHLAGPCKGNMVKCNTCLRSLRRKDLAMHYEVAHKPPAIKSKCPLRTSGCTYKGMAL